MSEPLATPSYGELAALVAEQAAQLAEQAVLIEALRVELEALRRQLGRDSSNSSQPPSSDGPGARAKAKAGRRSAGPHKAGVPVRVRGLQLSRSRGPAATTPGLHPGKNGWTNRPCDFGPLVYRLTRLAYTQKKEGSIPSRPNAETTWMAKIGAGGAAHDRTRMAGWHSPDADMVFP